MTERQDETLEDIRSLLAYRRLTSKDLSVSEQWVLNKLNLFMDAVYPPPQPILSDELSALVDMVLEKFPRKKEQ